MFFNLDYFWCVALNCDIIAFVLTCKVSLFCSKRYLRNVKNAIVGSRENQATQWDRGRSRQDRTGQTGSMCSVSCQWVPDSSQEPYYCIVHILVYIFFPDVPVQHSLILNVFFKGTTNRIEYFLKAILLTNDSEKVTRFKIPMCTFSSKMLSEATLSFYFILK